MVMNTPAIAMKNLAAGYPGTPVFSGLTQSIEQGRLFLLLGPNGCGKTTLLNCLLGLHKPSAGTVEVEGHDIDGLSPTALARRMAYVPQSHKKTFLYTVKEIVLMGRAAYMPVYGTPKKEDEQIAEEALRSVGIFHLADRPYVRLSGGEAQLVLLARAIAQKAGIIVLDEPTAHLDSYNELLVMDRLTAFTKENGLTVVMTTHYPNQAFYFMNKGLSPMAALMKNGSFLAAGECEEILTADAVANLYHVKCSLIETTGEDGKPIRQIALSGILEKENAEE